MRATTELNRRSFLRVAAGVGVAPFFLPALSYGRVMGANERVRLGIIGTGGIGHHHLRDLTGRGAADNVVVTRVCDVYRRRLNSAVGLVGSGGGGGGGASGSTGTMEYREILDDRSVDAVMVCTPDHWHTKIAIEAMEAGKDVYCEKPLSLTIEQALACRDAVRRTGRVLQVGPQATSEDRFWKAWEAIGAGRIGKVTWSQGSYCRNSREGQFNWAIDADAGPASAGDGHVWWDRWLGHEWGLAERIPWNADHFFRFRKYWAYNGGVATDLLYHKLAPLLLAITGPDGEYPARVVASGGKYIEKDERDIPDTFVMTVDYPSEHTVVLASVMTNDVGIDEIIRGQHGTMEFKDGLVIREQGAWGKEFRKANADQVPLRLVKNAKGGEEPEPRWGEAEVRIPLSERRDHMGNFLDAVRGAAKAHCNVELGCSTMVAIKMGVESYRRNKVMLWDAPGERAVES